MTRVQFAAVVFLVSAFGLGVGVLALRGAPAEADVPHEGMDFSIGIDVDGDGDNDCGTGAPSAVGDGAPDPVPVEVTSTDCASEADATLDVRMYLMDNGGLAYAGAGSLLRFSGLATSAPGHGTSHWTCHTLDATGTGANFEWASSVIGIAYPCDVPQTNLGLMNAFRLTCSQGGSIVLDHDSTGLVDLGFVEHRESGPDALSVTCGDLTPVPGTPPIGTPTPTPCLSCSSPQFALAVDVDGDGTHDCGTGVPLAKGDGAPDPVAMKVENKVCTGTLGEPLIVNAYLIDNAGVEYAGAAVTLAYEGVRSKGPGESVWDGCVFSVNASDDSFENVGCTIGFPPAHDVDHVGIVGRFEFSCDADGSLTLTHGPADTALTDAQFENYWEQGGEDRLDVLCEEAIAGDADCGGGVDSIDAALILQYGAGLLDALACKDAADVDEDGAVDARDAALVLQYAAGLIPGLG